MDYCDFAGPSATNFINTLCVKCGKPLGEHVVPGSHNVAIGEKALSALLQTPEERGVEMYYIDGPKGKVQQFRPKRQEGA